MQADLFEKLLEAAPDPIIIVAGKGVIARANAEAEKKFGYASAELVGQPIEILIPERYHTKHLTDREAYERAPHTRPMGSGIDLFAKRKDGHEIPVEISLSPLKTDTGTLIIAIVRDISERKTAERELKAKAEELARSNSELEQFAYIASHDLQEPLRAISGSCQLLERRYHDKLDDSGREFITFAVDGCRRMQQLIGDLLEYSRVTSKARPSVTVDCNHVMQQVRANLRQQIEERGATIEADNLPLVKGDPTQLVQLLQNLVSNGMKFHKMGQTPHVKITATERAGEVSFAVTDNGIGIDSKYFHRLFVIFKRLHSRDEYPGTGIGLAICKKIVERHGGAIWLESEPGRGAAFHFTLPKA